MPNPHRDFRVTSPNLHGQDVKDAQVDLDWWAKRFRLDPTNPDGDWGPDSRRLARQVLFLLGATEVRYMDAFTAHEQVIVSHRTSPELPPELSAAARRRSAVRRKAHTAKLKKAQSGTSGIVNEAHRWIGTSEHPAGSNEGPHISDWERAAGMGPGPWCGAFAIHCARTAGFVVPNSWVYTPTIYADAHAGRYGRLVPAQAIAPGDLVLYDWQGGSPSGIDHVGIATRSGNTESIEGNTASDNAGDQSNGGIVAIKHRGTAGGSLVCGVRLTKRS